MKIESSTIKMDSKREYIQIYEKTENLQFWRGEQNQGQNNNSQEISQNKKDILDISEQAKELQSKLNDIKIEDTDDLDQLSDDAKLKVYLVEKVIQMLTGKKVKINVPKIKDPNTVKCEQLPTQTVEQAQPKRFGWGLSYDYNEKYYEKEGVSFESKGIIKTSDGKEIAFSINVNMSREFAQEQNIRLRAGDAKVDPLVINFDGKAANITHDKFSFDIDSDGKSEQVSFTGTGSGFLAVDKNSDGQINNGSELFGPNVGDGFAELAQYDGDKNGWIDENDSIYSKLRIWTKDENGQDNLFALGEKGIGAIYLGNVETTFGIKDANNNSDGEVAQTGIFVKEDGTVGTVQHINLTV